MNKGYCVDCIWLEHGEPKSHCRRMPLPVQIASKYRHWCGEFEKKVMAADLEEYIKKCS